ncbi:MAG: glycosyltransferase [Microcella sp.]
MRPDSVLPLRWVHAVGGALSLLPDAAGRLLRPARYRDLPAARPRPEPLPPAARRVLLGPVNTAGQAHAWARALEAAHPGEEAAHAGAAAAPPALVARSLSATAAGPFAFPVDIAVPPALSRVSRDWQREHTRVRGFSATDVVIESGLPLFGPAFGQSLQREVRALQRRGIRVVIVCHGSDVRDVVAHAARLDCSPYRLPALAASVPAVQRRTRERRRAIRATGAPVLGTTHGVLIDLPEATWVPVVVDVAAWAVERPPLAARPDAAQPDAAQPDAAPLVVHAPSQSVIKGSDVIDAVLGRLAAEGLVRYERLEQVTHEAVAAAYRRADIMVDSVRMGGYGVAACEALAAGRVVVSNVLPAYRAAIARDHGLEVPIVQAEPETLEGVLRGLLRDPAAARATAERGPAFVRALHDGRLSAARILAALDSPAALGRSATLDGPAALGSRQ